MNIKDKVLSVALTYATGKMLDDPDIAYSSFGEFNWERDQIHGDWWRYHD